MLLLLVWVLERDATQGGRELERGGGGGGCR